MATICAYLTFNGNCREAMTFYKSCIGGELVFQTIGDSPVGDRLDNKMKDCILHATLVKGVLVLMGSDMVAPPGLIKGNTVSMALVCESESELRTCYQKLSDGGQANHPVEENYWGALFGDLTDKFGNHWLLNYEKTGSSSNAY